MFDYIIFYNDQIALDNLHRLLHALRRGGLHRDREDEFGKSYTKYSEQLSAFFPRLDYCLGKPIKLNDRSE